MNGNEVAVILGVSETNTEGEKDEKLTSTSAKPSVYWINSMFIGLINIVLRKLLCSWICLMFYFYSHFMLAELIITATDD